MLLSFPVRYLLKFNSTSMEVFINNQLISISGQATLANALLQHNFLDKKGIAVAVNNAVVVKPDWNSYVIAPGDKITIIRATQGG